MSNPDTGIDATRLAFVGLELRAVAALLRYWSKPHVIANRRGEWGDKLPAFRKAIGAGIQSGSKEAWPRELIDDDYQATLAVIEVLQRALGIAPESRSTESPIREFVSLELDGEGGRILYSRPLPVHRGCELSVGRRRLAKGATRLDVGRKPESVSRTITAMRLGVSSSTVKTVSRRPEKRRFHSRDIQRHLVSAFLDIASLGPEQPGGTSLMAGILDALLDSGYHALGLCHLCHKAHQLDKPIALGPYDPAEVERLCSAAFPSGTNRWFEGAIDPNSPP